MITHFKYISVHFNILKTKCLSKLFLMILVLFAAPLSAEEYAYMYIVEGTEVNLSNSWNTVAGFSEGMVSSGWSYASNTLMAASEASEGLYTIKYSLSFAADPGNWSVGISIDGATPIEPIFIRSISSSTKDAGNVSGVYHVSITQGQTVKLQVMPSVSSSDFLPIYAQVTLVKATQSTVNYSGGMYISSDQTYVDIGTAFVKLTGFSAVPEANDWTFASDGLTAGSNAAGNYYVSVSVSFSGGGSDNSPTVYSFEIVKNGVNGVTRIMANRKTSDTDIGNITATGLISVTAGDIISLEGKAGLNNKNLTIRKASLSLFLK